MAALKMDTYVSCIKMFGFPIVPPLMTDEIRQEMKEYKEKAMAYEQKHKGKRISLDSGVMIASTEMQKLENYESPTSVLKEPVFCDTKNIATQNIMKTDSSVSPETSTLVSEEEEYNLIDSSPNKESISIKSDNVSLIKNSCNTLITKQESTKHLIITNSTIHDRNYLDDGSSNKESVSIKSENISPTQNSCESLIPKQESPYLLTATNSITHDEDNTTSEQIPRLRSNSYTLSSPSPIMVAFLNSQVQQQLIEPRSIDNNINYIKESKSKSEPPSIYKANDTNDKVLMIKSNSLHTLPNSFGNQELANNLVKYRYPTVINEHMDSKTVSDEKQDERGSVTTIGTNFSNDGSIVGSVVTVCNGNSYENNSSPSSLICSKSMNHCCCRHSDDEYSISSNNIHYNTPEELNIEAERLRKAKLDIEKRHQEELSNLIKKQREEQEHIAVKYYLVSQSTSGKSLDGSECSRSFSKQLNTCSSSIQSAVTVTNDNSILSDVSIISNCSVKKNFICSSPRQKTPSHSPHLKQSIKFYHRIRSGMTARWTKAPDEVEHSAATVINAGVRGYLTRRLLRTEKALLLKKTILDSLKTALIMHMELKKQTPTISDLELHQRIINQLTTACYDLNDLILGSVHERMTVIKGDRERLKVVKMRRKSSSALTNRPSPSLRQPKKSTSSYSLSRKTSSNYEKSSYKR